MKLLSIVMPFYNRRQLLINTLHSIRHYKKDYPIEIIIVDDGSTYPETIPDIPHLFPDLNINLIVLNRNKLSKKRTPVVAYNTGFNAVNGDVVLINCAECIHMGDIIGYVFKNLNPKSYIAFSTYCGTNDLNKVFTKLNWSDPDVMIYAHIALDDLKNGWHSHSSHQTFIPFCAAVARKDLETLSGYDERFVRGIGYDDYDFTDRVENLGLTMRLIDSPFCVHQMHPSTVYSNTINIDFLWHLRKTDPKRIKAKKINTMSDKSICIVMTYWNRKKQLQNTLRSIARYGHNVNIIIIDDASTDGEDIHCFETDKISIVTLENKTWINPCIPFNIGFSLVNSDIVIIQNAECLHIGDIIGHALANSKDGHYLSYSAFYTNKEVSEKFNISDAPEPVVAPYLTTGQIGGGITNGWYNHSLYRPAAYHFCAAITRNDLYRIGGFDERYANGSAYDDDDFILRIRKAGIAVNFVYPPFVVHQYHEPFNAGDIPTMMAINRALFDSTRRSPDYDAKPYNKFYR